MEMGTKTTSSNNNNHTSELISKKLLNVLRIILMMMRKGISKTKLILDLHLILKRGNKLAGKAVESIFMLNHHHHHSSFSCKSSDDVAVLTTLKEYEFSCSDSPNYQYSFFRTKHTHHQFNKSNEDTATVAAVHRVLEILNNETGGGGGGGMSVRSPSPLSLPGFGFGKSPAWGRQLRITDSPFPLKEEESSEESLKVNKAADEFIKKFYKNLKKQTTVSGGGRVVDQSP